MHVDQWNVVLATYHDNIYPLYLAQAFSITLHIDFSIFL